MQYKIIFPLLHISLCNFWSKIALLTCIVCELFLDWRLSFMSTVTVIIYWWGKQYLIRFHDIDLFVHVCLDCSAASNMFHAWNDSFYAKLICFTNSKLVIGCNSFWAACEVICAIIYTVCLEGAFLGWNLLDNSLNGFASLASSQLLIKCVNILFLFGLLVLYSNSWLHFVIKQQCWNFISKCQQGY